MKSSKPILVLLLVFLAGLAVGVAGTRYVVRKQFEHAAREGGFFRDRMERELLNNLNLSAEQQEEVKKIFTRRWEEFRQLRTEFHPRFTNIAARTEADIKAVLTPEQRVEFEKLVKEKKALWRPPGGKPDRPPEGSTNWHERRGPGGGSHRDRREGTNTTRAPGQE
ncbi:MAG: hypothetical protein H0X66_13665 [Verrucomicrobia bacterium]|nr:hypothetical protein [Verrucomicrobiota bacterium]